VVVQAILVVQVIFLLVELMLQMAVAVEAVTQVLVQMLLPILAAQVEQAAVEVELLLAQAHQVQAVMALFIFTTKE
jgi:hypothetical protein